MSLTLLHSPAEVLSWLLVQMGQAVSWQQYNLNNALAWPIYVGNRPDGPDELLVMDDTAPVSDGRVMVGGEAQQHQGFTITVRGATRRSGWAKAAEVFRALCEDFYDQLVNVDGTPYNVHCVAELTGPLRLGRESPGTNRELLTINGTVTMHRKA